MSKKQDAYYFNLFIACAEDACKAAHLLKDTLMNFRPDKLKEQMDQIHEIEHAADEKKAPDDGPGVQSLYCSH